MYDKQMFCFDSSVDIKNVNTKFIQCFLLILLYNSYKYMQLLK